MTVGSSHDFQMEGTRTQARHPSSPHGHRGALIAARPSASTPEADVPMTVAEVRCAWDASMACSTSSALSAATKTKARLGAEPNIINACLTALRARAVISAGPGPCAIASPSPTSPTAVFSPIDGRHRRLGTHPSPNRGVGGAQWADDSGFSATSARAGCLVWLRRWPAIG